MCDIIWPPAPFKICYLARILKELHEPALKHAVCVNPRDADHSNLKLAADGDILNTK